VIAGFGGKEYFPSLYEFELETIANDQLKYVQRDITEIGPQDGRAVIRAFAQREQVATFMTGVDSSVREATSQFWTERLPELIGEIAEEAGIDDQGRASLLASADEICVRAVETRSTKASTNGPKRTTYIQSFA
jgi:hypothetical protein